MTSGDVPYRDVDDNATVVRVMNGVVGAYRCYRMHGGMHATWYLEVFTKGWAAAVKQPTLREGA